MKLLRPTVAGLLLCPVVCLALALPAAQAEPPAPRVATEVDVPTNATHGAIPFKQEKQATDVLAYQSFAALVLVGLAAYGIVFGLKRFGAMTGGPAGKVRRVRIIEAIRLGRRSTLHVIEYQGQELLLAESEHGLQLLISAPAPAAGQGAANA